MTLSKLKVSNLKTSISKAKIARFAKTKWQTSKK
jgi:hypothetical protein